MTDASPKMYCANHPNVETTLRCNNCEKPICAKCAVLTPTGYRCKECIRAQQKIFETSMWYDYPLVFIVVAFLSYLGSLLGGWIADRFGFYIIILALFLAPVVGGLIAEAARLISRRRRSKRLFILAAIAAVIGCLPVSLQLLQHFYLFGFIFQVMYAILMTSTLYYRLAGIKIG
jgi:MFS family permease